MQFTKKNSKSTFLMRLIGIGEICAPTAHLENTDVPSFLPIAEQNKIPLLFLKAVACNIKNRNIQHILSQYEEQHKNTLELIASTANLLEKIGVPYTFFKTLKPFPHTPSDIDILLLSDENLKNATKALKNQGCALLEKSIYGVTMFSPKHKMNIDLTTQIAVSSLIYLNKGLLFDYVSAFKIYGMPVQTLEPSADLLAFAAHGIFKEQMYTLNDYYTFTMLLQHWKEAMELAERFHLKHALGIVLRMTMAATLFAFGSANPLAKKFEEIGVTELNRGEFELPKKYDLATLIIAFLKKIREDPVSGKSMSLMARSVSNLAFYKKVLGHVTRQTY